MMDVMNLIESLFGGQVNFTAALILFLPLISFVTITSVKPKLYKKADVLSIGFLSASFVLSIYLLFQIWGKEAYHFQLTWFSLKSVGLAREFTLGLYIDHQAGMMLFIVSLISLLVHLFSMDYMYEDKHYARYFAYLGFFTFSMFGLVLSDNLLQLFVFWELVGFSSYLLIGFWYHRSSASKASFKAFMTNKVGDLGFLIALFVLFFMFETFDIEKIKTLMAGSSVENGSWMAKIFYQGTVHINQLPSYWIQIFGFGIFLATIAKSAQFPLQIWLPDAMKGPTPASALIHAATMVAAGIYLLVRVFPILHSDVLFVIACVGAFTAFIASISAVFQNDIKRVLAYSTSSQLGYMVMGVGVGAYDAAFFHMLTHAFFKAGLFLSVGVIIKSLHKLEGRLYEKGHNIHVDIQDMRYMGGLRKQLPFVFVSYILSSAALVGVPFFSGFLSKDAILVNSLAWASIHASQGNYLVYLIPTLGFVSIVFTAIYAGRQILLVFFGDFRLAQLLKVDFSVEALIEQANLKNKIPLAILSLLSFAFVFSYNPFSIEVSWVYAALESFKTVIPKSSEYWFLAYARGLDLADFHFLTIILSLILISLGLAYSYKKYHSKSAYVLACLDKSIKAKRWQNLASTNWRMDVFYRKLVISPVLSFSRFLHVFDTQVLDANVSRLKDLVVYLARNFSCFDTKILTKFYDYLAMFSVVFSHVIAFMDKYIVDGFVRSLAILSEFLGNKLRTLQGRDIQFYISRMLIILLIFVFIYCLNFL